MSMLFFIPVLIGLSLMTCIGLVRILKELLNATTSPEGAPMENWHDF
jgi:hypothetical protein